MENELQKMLEEELETQIKNLSRLGSGTKEKASAVEDVTKLYRLKLEEKKDLSETLDHAKEGQLRHEQLKREVIFRNIQLGTEILIFIAELGFAWHWARKGFEFEKDGTFTSGTMKSLFSKFKFRHKS